MKQPAVTALQIAAVAVAMLRGLGEFATLQRWRFKEWIAR